MFCSKARLQVPTLDDEPSQGAGIKMNGKGPSALVGVRVVTLLGGWYMSLQHLPMNEIFGK